MIVTAIVLVVIFYVLWNSAVKRELEKPRIQRDYEESKVRVECGTDSEEDREMVRRYENGDTRTYVPRRR